MERQNARFELSSHGFGVGHGHAFNYPNTTRDGTLNDWRANHLVIEDNGQICIEVITGELGQLPGSLVVEGERDLSSAGAVINYVGFAAVNLVATDYRFKNLRRRGCYTLRCGHRCLDAKDGSDCRINRLL